MDADDHRRSRGVVLLSVRMTLEETVLADALSGSRPAATDGQYLVIARMRACVA